MADPNDRLVLKGVGLKASPPQPALIVYSGQVEIHDTAIDGYVRAQGADTAIEIADSRITASPFVEEVASVATSSAGEYGLYFSKNDCLLAVVSSTQGAQFKGYNVEISDHQGIGVCVDAASCELCGGSIHDIHLLDYQFGRGASCAQRGRADSGRPSAQRTL